MITIASMTTSHPVGRKNDASSPMPKDKVAARDWDACAEYVHMLLTKAKGE